MALGNFEYVLLAAAARLGGGAYGAAIRKEIESATWRRCSIGSIYITLDRLEAKGFVRTQMGDPTPQRGGRARRMVHLTPQGVREASDFYAEIRRATRRVPWEAGQNAGGA
ncbi:MAG: PadR family transcriptional regulator [Terriglobales bacterium]